MTLIAVARGNFSLRTCVTLSSPSVWEANIRCTQCSRGSCDIQRGGLWDREVVQPWPLLGGAGSAGLVGGIQSPLSLTTRSRAGSYSRLLGLYPGSLWYVYVYAVACVCMCTGGQRTNTAVILSHITLYLETLSCWLGVHQVG